MPTFFYRQLRFFVSVAGSWKKRNLCNSCPVS
jgi:hypothetical protein